MNKSISSLPSIFIQRRWPAIATFVSVICGALAYLVITPRMYQASIKVMVDNTQGTLSDYGRELAQPSAMAFANPMANQAELAKSERVLEQALALVSSQGMKNLPDVGTFKNNLKVKIIPATSLLDISYRSKNPVLTSELLNALAEVMVKQNTEGFRSQARSAREFLETEIPKERAQLAQAEAAESYYKKSSSVVSVTEQTKSLVENLAALEAQQGALSAQLQEAKVRDDSLKRTMDNDTLRNAYAAVRSGQDEELKGLRANLADLESQVTISRTRLTDTNPVLLKLIEKRNSIRAYYTKKLSRLLPNSARTNSPINVASDQVSQDLATKLILGEIERSGLAARLDVVRRNQAEFQARLNQLPAKEERLIALTRQREEAAASVQLLQSKLQEARIAEAQLGSQIKIMDTASPPTAPNWPNVPIVLVIATAAGITLSIGVVMLLEVLDDTLRNATEAEKLVKLPILGLLPVLTTTSLSTENSELLHDNSGVVESYRMLLKKMEFCSLEPDLRVVVVSSTISGEGKSVVVSHLAAVSAMWSRRTLIIDTDFRCPTQHKLFGLAAQPGLTDVIDRRVTCAEAVQQTSIEHLSVLTCGSPHPRTSQLLQSAQMRNLLAEAATQYDLVIVDTPPIISYVDATILGRHSNGLLLVTRPKLTQRDVLLRAVAELIEHQVPILGVAVNGITNQTGKYYRYAIQGDQPLANRLNR